MDLWDGWQLVIDIFFIDSNPIFFEWNQVFPKYRNNESAIQPILYGASTALKVAKRKTTAL